MADEKVEVSCPRCEGRGTLRFPAISDTLQVPCRLCHGEKVMSVERAMMWRVTRTLDDGREDWVWKVHVERRRV